MKTIFKIFHILLLTIITAGCSNDENPSSLDNINDIPSLDEIELNVQEMATNEAINEFGFNLFKRICAYSHENKHNVLISPFEGAISLASIANGCDESAENKIKEVLNYRDISLLNQTCNKLLRYIPAWSNGAQMAIGNSVWFSGETDLDKSFVNTMNNMFYAEVNRTDFGPEHGKSAINAWCNTKTHGKITTLLDDINPTARLLFANTLFFDGYWLKEFNSSKTHKSTFLGTSRQSEVDMMFHEYVGFHYDFEKADGIPLNLNGGTTVLFLLPKKGVSIDELTESFSYSEWSTVDTDAHRSQKTIMLYIPKFAMECATDIGLTFRMMGLASDKGDFRQIGAGSAQSYSVLQKVRAVIDEEGYYQTTDNNNVIPAYSPYPDSDGDFLIKVRRIIFDRPFLFFVYNNITKTIVVAGKICDIQ